jgi:hypothetical protein
MKPLSKIRKFKLHRGRKPDKKFPRFYVVKSLSANTYVQRFGFGRALTLDEAWKTTDRKHARRIRNRENSQARYWKQRGYDVQVDFVIMPVRSDVQCTNKWCDNGWDMRSQPDTFARVICQTCLGRGKVYHEFAA